MQTKSKFRQVLGNIFKPILVFVVIFILTYTIIALPALWSKAKFVFSHKPATQAIAKTYLMAYDNHLIIPKLDINVPITWNVPADNNLPALENGVAHYAGTAHPGEIGNVFIFGHSSYYWWNKGSYKEIFANLDQLQVGDKIYATFQGQAYTYTVTEKKVVKPTQTEVLNQTHDRIISLMTCVPVGTTLNRLVVIAQQN